jgi:hypothetical protein
LCENPHKTLVKNLFAFALATDCNRCITTKTRPVRRIRTGRSPK